MKLFALVGQHCSKKIDYDLLLSIPSTNTQFIQEVHLTIEHILCDLVEYILFNKNQSKQKISCFLTLRKFQL